MVSLDLVGFFNPNVVNARKQLPGFAHVLVSSTHTHEGPDTLGLWGPSPFESGVDPEYVNLVEDRIVEAVKQAGAAAKPVTARLGTVRTPELLHDSREPILKHDELVVLQFISGADRKPAGIVVQWNNHPETVNSGSTEITSDYVGVTVNYLKAKYGCPVAYFTGTVGGLMTTIHVAVKDRNGKVLPEGSWEKTERYGVLLGEASDQAIKDARDIALMPLRAATKDVYIPMENELYLLGRQLGVLKRDAFLWKGNTDRADPADPKEREKPLCLKTEISLLRLGELDVACIPGEIYPELVLGKVQDPADPGADFPEAPIEAGIYPQLRSRRMIIGLANDEIGYIIPKRQWDVKKPYCYGKSKSQYGETNSVGPEAGPIICKAFAELARKTGAP
jgi:hypothetical protein